MTALNKYNLIGGGMDVSPPPEKCLKNDLKKYMNRLRLVHGEISQFNRDHIKLESKFRFKLLSDQKTFVSE